MKRYLIQIRNWRTPATHRAYRINLIASNLVDLHMQLGRLANQEEIDILASEDLSYEEILKYKETNND